MFYSEGDLCGDHYEYLCLIRPPPCLLNGKTFFNPKRHTWTDFCEHYMFCFLCFVPIPDAKLFELL